MHHEVAHGEIRIALDPLAGGGQLLFGCLLFVPAAEELGVGQDRQLDIGVFQPRGEGADADAALPVPGKLLQLRVDKRGDVVILEKFLQHFGPALVPGQDHHPVVLLPVGLYVIGRGLGAAGIGGQLLGRDAGEGLGRQGGTAYGKGVGHVQGIVLQAPHQRVPAEGKGLGAKGHLAPLLQLPQVLLQLLLVVPGTLGAAGGLVHNQKGLRREIIHAAGLGVDQGEVAVRVGEDHPAPQPFRVGPQGGRQGGGVLTAALAGKTLRIALDLPCQCLHAPDGEPRQGLGGGQDHAAADGLAAALGGHVKVAHGVDLIPPELDAHRLRVRGGEKVQDAAPAGELARALHLLGPAVAAAEQRVLHVLDGVAAPVFQGEGGLFQGLRREGPLHKARDGGGEYRGAPRLQGVERGDTLLLRLAGGGLRRVKGEVPHPQGGDLGAQHGPQVVCHVFCRGVVRAEDHQGKPGFQAQRRGQIGPVHRRKAGNERRKPSALQQGGEGGGFLVCKDLLDEQFHNGGIIAEMRRGSNGNLRPGLRKKRPRLPPEGRDYFLKGRSSGEKQQGRLLAAPGSIVILFLSAARDDPPRPPSGRRRGCRSDPRRSYGAGPARRTRSSCFRWANLPARHDSDK